LKVLQYLACGAIALSAMAADGWAHAVAGSQVSGVVRDSSGGGREITGPTIVDPSNPDLDYSYCSSDRRHVVNISAVARTPESSNRALHVILGDWQLSPLVRWQSGNRSTITTGVDNALTGMGGQRAVQFRWRSST
jgi:hypothetical protein